MKHYICIDIGGTEMKYGVLDEAAAFLHTGYVPTDAQKGGMAVLNKAIGLVSAATDRYPISGICISTAGMVDVETGVIFHAGPQIPDYAGTRIRDAMEEAFGIPCEVDNDVKCAGLAEATCGAGQGATPCLCLTVGTGIGGCLVMDGRVYRGFSGSACEIGYMQIEAGASLQELASASALSRRASEAKGRPLDGREVFRLVSEGDRECIQAVDMLIQHLTTGLANLIYTLNPEVVVLGGGIMVQQAYLKPRIRTALEAKLVPALRQRTRLTFARAGNRAGMLGAWLHFQQMQARRSAQG